MPPTESELNRLMQPNCQPKTPATMPAILVIERQRFHRRAFCRLLRAAGANKVFEAADLHAATRLIADHEASSWVVAADPDEFGPSGLQALQALNANENHAVFLLVSKRRGDALEMLRLQAHQEGMTLLAALRKPVSGEEMETLLRRIPQDPLPASNGRIPLLTKDELGECLRVGRLKARFQPKVDLGSGRPVSCEAVPFVLHLRYGEMPPASFSRALAQLGAQRVMTASVLRDSAEFVRAMREKGLSTTVSVNITPEVLSESGDAASLDAYVRTLGVTPSDLALEISESPGPQSPAAFAENLARLKLRGYRLAMDETTAPVHIDEPTHAHFSEIKLGHNLVSKLATDAEVSKTVASTVNTAHRFGMTACALGLQTMAELDRARAVGIDLGQGALFSDSLPAGETLAWLEREEKARSFKQAALKRHRVG